VARREARLGDRHQMCDGRARPPDHQLRHQEDQAAAAEDHSQERPGYALLPMVSGRPAHIVGHDMRIASRNGKHRWAVTETSRFR
jgi:hypothetical protein